MLRILIESMFCRGARFGLAVEQQLLGDVAEPLVEPRHLELLDALRDVQAPRGIDQMLELVREHRRGHAVDERRPTRTLPLIEARRIGRQQVEQLAVVAARASLEVGRVGDREEIAVEEEAADVRG